MFHTIGTLFEVQNQTVSRNKNPLSTSTFDWLYTALSILLTVGIIMDVWSHIEFGPDQSIFNEYHLLFYGAMGAILLLLVGLHTVNVRKRYAFAHALPQGYGLGLLATLLFGVSGVIDLTGHALFGFESDIEALTSPTHLLLFSTWCLILYAPVRALAARVSHTGKSASLRESLPMLICSACMLFTVFVPLMSYFPMGSEPVFLQQMRPNGYDGLGTVYGIAGILLQTIIFMGFVQWTTRQFRLPRGSFTLIFSLLGVFIGALAIGMPEMAMFFAWGISLDILYAILRPDGTQRGRFILFAFFGALTMWACALTTYGWFFGFDSFWFSGYNLYGAVAQSAVLSTILGYMLTLEPAEPRFAQSRFAEVS